MKDQWYADNRDLIKWGGIIHLCNTKGIKQVTHVAYYTQSSWPKLRFDGVEKDISKEVTKHFRDINDIKRLGKKAEIAIDVIKERFSHSRRKEYNESVIRLIKEQKQRQIVFLDPDTGLAPQKAMAEHVTGEEISSIWQCLKGDDYLVLYQHKPRISEWKIIRKKELAKALSVKDSKIKMWEEATEKIRDVVFFFCEK